MDILKESQKERRELLELCKIKDNQLRRLNRKYELLRECVEFYADKNKWVFTECGIEATVRPCDRENIYYRELDIFIASGGKKARKTLRQIEELER